jgi:hypothetical protein
MSNEFNSIMEGLNDLLEYAKGDKTKGRSKIVTAEEPSFPELKDEQIAQLKPSHLRPAQKGAIQHVTAPRVPIMA